jgi:hypothetical protein
MKLDFETDFIGANVLWIILGMTIRDIVWYLRFLNPTLKRELIITMRDGNDYFLTFIYFDILVLLIFLILAVWINDKMKRRKRF